VSNPEQFSSLIGDIYEAAMEPALWPGVLKQIAAFVGGSAAAFYSKDAATKTGSVYYDCGASDPHFKQLYFEKYIKIDPTTAGHCFAPVGEPVTTADILDYNEFLDSRFYREWVRPQELVDNVSVALDKSATGTALLGVFRNQRQGHADDEARRRVRLIAPHVRRAALVARAMAHKSAQVATLADTVDGLSAGVFLVDASARIVHANAAAQAILAQGTVLRSPNGKLVATDPDAARILGDVLERSEGGDRAVNIRAVAVPLAARNGERYVAHVLALASAARRGADGYAAAAAVLVQKTALEAKSAIEAIASTFKLTPSELRVLLAIVELTGVPETADALGVGQATVKTHLHRVFRKTATTRQADLIRLVAGFSSPLVG
jgi:DNA-binding CsgD family transcriptional regulator/PAS domain-containing protein